MLHLDHGAYCFSDCNLSGIVLWSCVTMLHGHVLLFLTAVCYYVTRPCSSQISVAFKIYDMDKDGYISNGELFSVLKMMVGNNLKDAQLQQIVDKTIILADKDDDGKISFEEFCFVSDHSTLLFKMCVAFVTVVLMCSNSPVDVVCIRFSCINGLFMLFSFCLS